MQTAAQTTFNFKGAVFTVLDYSYSINRNLNNLGQTTTAVNGGQITITIQALEKNNELFASLVTTEDGLRGDITVRTSNLKGTLKTIKFEEGYLINYGESWDILGNGLRQKFTVTANKLEVDGLKHDFKWVSA